MNLEVKVGEKSIWVAGNLHGITRLILCLIRVPFPFVGKIFLRCGLIGRVFPFGRYGPRLLRELPRLIFEKYVVAPLNF